MKSSSWRLRFSRYDGGGWRSDPLRKVVNWPSDLEKEKDRSIVRDAATGRFLLLSKMRLKDVLVHLRKRGDYVIVAHPLREDDEVIEEISIETIPWHLVSDRERGLVGSCYRSNNRSRDRSNR